MSDNTKDKFIEQFARYGHRTEPGYTEDPESFRVKYGRYDREMVVLYMDAAPCDCGAAECIGWKMHSKTLESPSDCGIDPLMMHGPFGPPYSLMSREDQESVDLVPGPPSDIEFTIGGLPGEWKCLAEVKPVAGHLVEYRGVCPERTRKHYEPISVVSKRGRFITDCGSSLSERLDGFTTEVLGVIVAPDPNFTLWRHVVEPGVKYGSPDTGIVCDANYTIIEEGKQVGKFWFDEEIKRFKFEGDLEQSAQIFAQHILTVLNREKNDAS